MSNSICPKTGKVCYETSVEAHVALDYIKKKRKAKYGLNKVYQCEFCGLYHLTKEKKIDNRSKL